MADDLPFLPYGHQSIDEDDIAAVAEVLRGDWLTTGPAVAAFETAFAAKVGADFAVACSSGTAALHLAALALGLGPGDRAVVPTLTFLATANAARYVGAEVLFADVDPETGLMEARHLEAALDDPRAGDVKAVFPVHLNGQCADAGAIAAIAAERGLKVVEDACHALGATDTADDDGPHPVGACRHADMAIFSLHPVKTITMGEGGVITTNDGGLDRHLRRLRNIGMVRDAGDFRNAEQAFDTDGNPNPWYYEMPEPGFNYRASDIHCALGLSQLGKLDAFAATRRALADRYAAALAPLAPVVRPIGRNPSCSPVWHLYVVLIDFETAGLGRARLMNRLRDAGIGTQVHYLPLHRQPYFADRYGERDLPGADAYYRTCLSLPLSARMTEADVDRVAAALGDLLASP
jgi:UDP-4-amino-4,6-dideoxy-N-acetyl-beta-L-altrosamine transaminase